MILKKRKIPARILFDEALLRRIPENHPKWKQIYDGNQLRRAGYNGEKSLDHFLNNLPDEKYAVFHDLHLPHKNTYFQIYTLLLSTSMAIILEVKNVSGKLLFDINSQQFIRTLNGEEQGMQDPLTQARRHKQHLESLFQKFSVPDIPVEYLVVISFASSIFTTNPPNSPLIRKICHGYSLNEKIQELEKSNCKEKHCVKTWKKTCRLILNKHVPQIFGFTALYEIQKDEIITGVRCPSCSSIPMQYSRGRWHCIKCHHVSSNAHIESLKEYSLLFNVDITNSEMRHFLHLPSCKVTSKFIKTAKLPCTGSTKGRVYHLQSITE